MYWYYNKKTKEAAVYSSITAISNNTSLKYDSLSYQFGRKKRKEYETEDVRIVKTKLIRSKRK